MTYTNFTSASTCQPLNFSDLKKIVADFDRRWPKSERCQRMGLCPYLYWRLDREFEHRTATQFRPFDTLSGIPFGVEYGLPKWALREYMADGSSVLTYANGRKVRCLFQPQESEPCQPKKYRP